ncbi:DUF4365 domain-containing protein [Streptomyces albus]|uniref:DUF4365 domain-containing protein n=1 Tax=Streptomyces sp. NRRL F-5639 TaxID=1463867 RepID=UPI0004C69D9A|nr:DUF4365 domain-containing protein [Streptomyces sp. NRRL F-5639]
MSEGTTGHIPAHLPPQSSTSGLEVVPAGRSGHKGDFGEQFVRALAAAANLDASRRDLDRVGVDWQLGYLGRAGTLRYPSIDVQVKFWSKPTGSADAWHYPLEIKNYNWLAGRDWQLPRFLFLVIAPDDPQLWTDVTDDRFLLRHAAYWASFHGCDPVPPKDSTLTVHVPKANLLTVKELNGLFSESFREMLVTP